MLSPRRQVMARVVCSRALCPGIFELRIEAAEIARRARPGQFVHLKVSPGYDPFLRRPLSIGAVDAAAGTVDLAYRVIGHGTDVLSRVEPGGVLDVLGPLGNPFRLHADRPAVMVAGGLGVADFPFLAKELAGAGCPELHLVQGARTESELVWRDRFEALGVKLHAATDDGTAGQRGVCTELLADVMGQCASAPALYACGPEPMFRAILAIARDDEATPIQLAFEQRMGCGFGACLACAVETNRGYVRACTEGPVLEGSLFRNMKAGQGGGGR